MTTVRLVLAGILIAAYSHAAPVPCNTPQTLASRVKRLAGLSFIRLWGKPDATSAAELSSGSPPMEFLGKFFMLD
jgi:hypothetical protein